MSQPPISQGDVERHVYDRACRNAQHSGCTCMQPVNGRWCGKQRNDPIHDVEPSTDDERRMQGREGLNA